MARNYVVIPNCRARVEDANGNIKLALGKANMQLFVAKEPGQEPYVGFDNDSRPVYRLRVNKGSTIGQMPVNSDVAVIEIFKGSPELIGRWTVEYVQPTTGSLPTFVLFVKREMIN